MQRIVFIYLLIVFTSCVNLQFVDVVPVSYNISTELTSAQNYDKSLSFIAHYFQDPTTVIKLANREGGEIVLHAKKVMDSITLLGVSYIMTIKVKDKSVQLSFQSKEKVHRLLYEDVVPYFEKIKTDMFLYLNIKDEFKGY